MRIPLIVIAGALIISGTASASIIEDTTGFHYQNDGGRHSDAPGTCEELELERQVTIGGNSTKGVLVAQDDESDFYNMPMSADLVGTRVFISVRADQANLAALDLDVQLPGCLGSVFDPATYEAQREMLANDPKYSRTEPPAVGEKTVEAHKLTGYECDPTEWHFIVNQVAGDVAPDHIRLQWSNGDIENVPIQKRTPATVVHYRTTSNLDQPIWSASVNIFEAWDGRFNLGSGPCNGSATEPPEVYVPPIDNGKSGSFTVVSPLSYAAQARLVEAFSRPSGQRSCHEGCGELLTATELPFGYFLKGEPEEQAS